MIGQLANLIPAMLALHHLNLLMDSPKDFAPTDKGSGYNTAEIVPLFSTLWG